MYEGVPTTWTWRETVYLPSQKHRSPGLLTVWRTAWPVKCSHSELPAGSWGLGVQRMENHMRQWHGSDSFYWPKAVAAVVAMAWSTSSTAGSRARHGALCLAAAAVLSSWKHHWRVILECFWLWSQLLPSFAHSGSLSKSRSPGTMSYPGSFQEFLLCNLEPRLLHIYTDRKASRLLLYMT